MGIIAGVKTLSSVKFRLKANTRKFSFLFARMVSVSSLRVQNIVFIKECVDKRLSIRRQLC
jgi:hypothetical protein